ncbi:MAG: sulfatase [Planctomycetes bacterium]|nr:sulfatase [Planctomycetota bacterium]
MRARTCTSLLPAALALFAALLPACSGKAADAERPNVVVIVLDTVRPDYLSAYGFDKPTSPYLEEFAKEGTRFERAWSSSSWTLPAHASLFSGTGPVYHRATQATEHVAQDVPLLAERLRDAGYQTLGLSANMWVSRTTGLDRGFEEFHDEWSFRQRLRARASEHPFIHALRGWFERVREPKKPFFAFFNLTAAHMPYLSHWEEAQPFFENKEAWQAAITELFPDNGTGLLIRQFGTGKKLDERELGNLRALYEGTLRRVDAITAALMSVVDQHADPKNTLVFVLSDHGENLGEHEQISHMFNLYESTMRIALLARGPGFGAGVVEEHQAQITDIYPTVLRAAGLEPEPICTGLDLRGDLPERRTLTGWLERPTISMGIFPQSVQQSGVLARYDHTLGAAIGPEFKQLLAGDGGSELFDIARDPGETAPLSELPPEPMERLRRVLEAQRALEARRRSADWKGNALQDPHSRKGLQDLGYTGEDK